MGEQFEAPKPKLNQEAGKAVAPDVVKIGDSERKTPEVSRAMKMVSATTEFLDDLGKANLVAKKELGELASTRIGKAIAVVAIGGGLEGLSKFTLGSVLDRFIKLFPSKTTEEMSNIVEFLNHPFIREALDDVSVFWAFREGNKFIGNKLPEVPASYLGGAVGVNALDWAVREKFGTHKPLKEVVKEVFDMDPDGKTELTTRSLKRVPLADASKSESKKGRFDFIPRTAGKVVDYSNPVTLYGTAQVVEGASAYVRAVRDIRKARKTGGETNVDMLLAQAKKAKPVEARRDKQERLLDLYEKAGKDE